LETNESNTTFWFHTPNHIVNRVLVLSLAIDDTLLGAWLIEASLHARSNGSAPLKDLLDSPGLFPFRLKPMSADSLMAASSKIDIVRHGLDDDLVMLRKQPAKSSSMGIRQTELFNDNRSIKSEQRSKE
jgi:hypothetical protein